MFTTSINEARHVLTFNKRVVPFNPLPPYPTLPPFSLSEPLSVRVLTFLPPPDMSDQSAPSHLKVLFEAALQDYEIQTGIALAKHPLTERLQKCDSVESITAVLHEQTQDFNEFRGKDKIMKSLKNTVSVLCKLSASAKLGEVIRTVHQKPLTGCSIHLTSFHRSFLLRRQYTLDSLFYFLYVIFLRSQSRISVTSKFIRRSRASRTVMMRSSNCLSQSNSYYLASTSIRRSLPQSL